MRDKTIIRIANVLSKIFTPFLGPMWAFIWLFFFSYLSLLPLGYKLYVLIAVLLFTVIVPCSGINIFRRVNKWTHIQLSTRENRFIPYILTIISYGVCYYIFSTMNTAQFMKGILVAALVAQILCTLINIKWKISTHMVGIGGLAGIYVAFSYVFGFNPIGGLSLLILLSGLLGSARMILRQHTLAQVIVGFVIGFFIGWFFVLIGF